MFSQQSSATTYGLISPWHDLSRSAAACTRPKLIMVAKACSLTWLQSLGSACIADSNLSVLIWQLSLASATNTRRSHWLESWGLAERQEANTGENLNGSLEQWWFQEAVAIPLQDITHSHTAVDHMLCWVTWQQGCMVAQWELHNDCIMCMQTWADHVQVFV